MALEWPPIYDPSYVPPADQEYWDPTLETMPPEQRQVVEGIMEEQMQNLLGMAGPASITAEILVEEVRVNEGAPGA